MLWTRVLVLVLDVGAVPVYTPQVTRGPIASEEWYRTACVSSEG